MAIEPYDNVPDDDMNEFLPYDEGTLIVHIPDEDLAFPLAYVPPGLSVAPEASVELTVPALPSATETNVGHAAPHGGHTPLADELSPEDAIELASPVESTDSDDDLDDASSDTSSNLTEVRPYEFPSYFSQVNGRLFHSHGTSRYPMPVDGLEQKRLDAQHTMLRLITGRNYDGPVQEVLAPDNRPKKVVDLCTGTGLWVQEMAREFPHVDFRGLDLDSSMGLLPIFIQIARLGEKNFIFHSPYVPIATQYPHDNVRFQLSDVTHTLPFADNSVELVHARMTWLGVQNYPSMLREIARILRPGGLFLSGEYGGYPALHPSHPMHANPAAYIPHSARFYSNLTEDVKFVYVSRACDGELTCVSTGSKGIPSLALRLPHLIRANGSFTAPHEQRRAIPISRPYAPTPSEPCPQTGRANGSADFVASIYHGISVEYARALLMAGRMSPEIAEGFVIDINTKPGMVAVWHTTWARKL
ncbi:S-adenosyl-L-methionine-dependent methyltransferase [Auriscalpium vulgare]|uniref:S-adenosyl-L-methionine-dependent methyltransferase n=1 Tax=Auriscalpium vulgare TaxID=40419 RepID=A0ACB8RYV8_9AGAM|nr:S-adenosyl-L-methionine-dependent methyltransferase [Auriscalpium vulgare]